MNTDQDLKKILTLCVKKIFKKFRNYKYKKLQEAHPNTFGHENIRQFFESVYLKTLLELEEIEPENVDEFSLNTRKEVYKGWIKRW